MIEVKLDINKRDLENIRKMPAEFRVSTEKGFEKAMLFAERMAKRDFEKSRGGAGGLHVRTGNLRRSISSGVDIRGGDIIGWVASGSVYASPHELGSRMRTKSGSTFKMPKRPFLEPGITENIETIKNTIRNSIIKEVNR